MVEVRSWAGRKREMSVRTGWRDRWGEGKFASAVLLGGDFAERQGEGAFGGKDRLGSRGGKGVSQRSWSRHWYWGCGVGMRVIKEGKKGYHSPGKDDELQNAHL